MSCMTETSLRSGRLSRRVTDVMYGGTFGIRPVRCNEILHEGYTVINSEESESMTSEKA